MTPRRPNRMTMLAGVGGVVLALSLSLPWYRVTLSFDGVSRSASATGWRALATDHVILLLLGLAAAGLVMVQSSRVESTHLVRFASPMLVAVGVLATTLVLYRLIRSPINGTVLMGKVHVAPDEGAIMALVAALAITAGGARGCLEDERGRRGPAGRAPGGDQSPLTADFEDHNS